MTLPKPVYDRLRTYIYLRDIHPVEWFHDFDPLNQSRVSEAQFRRALETTRIPLREGDFEQIVAAFREPDGTVNYRAFCDAVCNIYTNIQLEKQPLGHTKNSQRIVQRTLNKVGANTDQQVEALLSKCAHQVTTRGVHIRESYMDFDRHNSGNITQSQFLRAMPFRDFTAGELQLLIKRYADPILRDFNYRRWHNDVCDYIRQKSDRHLRSPAAASLLPHQRASLRFRDFNQNPDAMIANFAKHVYEKRIRIREFFEQHDPLRLGVIPVNKFEGTLTQFGYAWTQDDLDSLTAQYITTVDYTNYIRWREFCDDIDALADFQHAECASRAVATPTDEAVAVLNRIRSEIVRCRINILPTMQDFDRLGRGYVTRLQFQRALSALRIHLANRELDLLARLYEVLDKGFDFYKFIEDVDPTHHQTRRSFHPLGTTRHSIEELWGRTPTGDRFVTGDEADEMIYEAHKGLVPKINEHGEYNALMADLQRWCFINSVHFHDFLDDFDRLKINEITANQFRSGIAKSTYHLTDAEYECLVNYYRSDTREGYVKWRKFADDVIQFIAPKNLEKDPQTTPPCPGETIRQRSGVQTTVRPTAEIDKILDLVARFVQCRRISLPEQFQLKDKMNHRRVSATGFAQVLHILGIFITKAQIDKLCWFYNDPQNNFVDYPHFIKDVYAKAIRIFGDRASSSLVVHPIPAYGFENSDFLVQQRQVCPWDLEWQEILERLSAFVYRRRIRILEFFEGFDALRHGIVPKQKFRTVCGQADLPLTPKQIDAVLEHFSVPDKSDMFNYREFCREVNAVFGPTDLNKTPLREGKIRAVTRPDPSETLQSLKSPKDIEFEEILERMRRIVRSRRMNIREQFWDYDRKPRKCYISMQQFRQSIARLGLTKKPRDLEILCKRYCSTDLNDMNYYAFCNDIDPE
jgi:Ca2+-binding EF-hand superfamily protein